MLLALLHVILSQWKELIQMLGVLATVTLPQLASVISLTFALAADTLLAKHFSELRCFRKIKLCVLSDSNQPEHNKSCETTHSFSFCQ